MTSSLTSRCHTLPDLTSSATGQGQMSIQNGLQYQSRSSVQATYKADGRRTYSNLPTITSQQNQGGSSSRICRPVNSAGGVGANGVQNSVRPKSYVGNSSYTDLKEANNELFARLRERRLLLEKLEGKYRPPTHLVPFVSLVELHWIAK